MKSGRRGCLKRLALAKGGEPIRQGLAPVAPLARIVAEVDIAQRTGDPDLSDIEWAAQVTHPARLHRIQCARGFAPLGLDPGFAALAVLADTSFIGHQNRSLHDRIGSRFEREEFPFRCFGIKVALGMRVEELSDHSAVIDRRAFITDERWNFA